MTMMLADPLENLTESFRRQRLDDSLKGECFGHLKSTVGLQQTVPCRISSGGKTLVYQCEREGPRRTTSVDRTIAINCKTEISSMSAATANPSKDVKHCKTFKERYLKPKATLPELIDSSLKDKDFLDKPESSLEILSSSEEELRELCLTQTKTFRISNQVPHIVPHTSPVEGLRVTTKGKIGTSEKDSGFVDVDDRDISRKRFKTTRGSFKKKIKLSRPSLNMDKMLATRLSLNKDLISNGNFYPIENV